MARDDGGKTATLYRMVMPDHLCPYGLKSKDLLERHGFAVEDHPLETHDETEAFKKEHGVETTPQAFIGGERIGGYDDLREHFGQTASTPRPRPASASATMPAGPGCPLIPRAHR
jgi:glutaredoxin